MNERHAIQLEAIFVTQLNCVVNDPLAAKDYSGDVDLKIQLGTSDISPDEPTIGVGVKISVEPEQKTEDGKPIFQIFVDLNGQFSVDLKNFEFQYIELWAKTNAPFLLLPYVREHVYGLALRAGIPGLILPLFTQPRKPPPSEK